MDPMESCVYPESCLVGMRERSPDQETGHGENLFFVSAQSSGRRGYHLVELAVAGGAGRLVTHNLKDFKRPELLPLLRSITPGQFVKEFLS